MAQTVLEHGSATVGFEQDRPLLSTVVTVLPDNCTVTLLADRGFEQVALIRWLRQRGWSWCIRAKCDLQVNLATGKEQAVAQLLPQQGQANLFHQVRILSVLPRSAHSSISTLTSMQSATGICLSS